MLVQFAQRLTLALALVVLAATSSSAAIILTPTSTIDTDQGLEFLHVPQYTTTSNYATAAGGISLLGYNWNLATADQFVELISNATGVPLATWNGSNHGDTNFSTAQAASMMAALGYGTPSNTDWLWLDGGVYGPSRVLAHTGFDDFHLNQFPNVQVQQRALYVRATAAVPEPSTLAIWSVLGGIGYVVRRRRKKA